MNAIKQQRDAQVSPAKPSSQFGITEILMPYGESIAMVMPMLAHLSAQQNDRWLTWIVPANFDKATLKNYSFNIRNVRLIYAQSHEESLWLFWEALSKGNSGSVVAHLDHLSELERARLEEASLIGNTRGLVIGNR